MVLNNNISLKQGTGNLVKPEVLAPAGKWDVLEEVVTAGADAVYLGGKKLNMRMWRSEFNFSMEELQKAVEYVHQRGVKLYVTLNNLYYESDLTELRNYLQFLEEIKVDALIIQDLAIVNLVHELGISRPLHASVQANVHNLEGVFAFKELGVTRIIASKDLTLEELYWWGHETEMELEYFVHGDLCVAHTGQCFTSCFMFGESSNRGRCLKPCRWAYKVLDLESGQSVPVGGNYVLATKDLCLYPFIPQLIQAGIVSFKIEGRMREGEYLRHIVKAYREAVDRYCDDPAGYSIDQSVWNNLVNMRVRDFTTGQALGYSGATKLGITGEREPYFPTHPVLVPTVNNKDVWKSKKEHYTNNAVPELSVRVGNLSSLRSAIEAGAKRIYVGGEVTSRYHQAWGRKEIEAGLKEVRTAGAQLVVMTPKITKRREIGELDRLIADLNPLQIDGFMVGNWGSCWYTQKVSDRPVYGDYSLNLANSQALKCAKKLGLTQATASLELDASSLEDLLSNTEMPIEVLVHGVLTGMMLDFSLPEAWLTERENGIFPCIGENTRFALQDDCGQRYQVALDQFGRTHIQFPNQICLLTVLPWLVQLGVKNFRIEAQNYSEEVVYKLVMLYRKYLQLAVERPEEYSIDKNDWGYLERISPVGYTLGSLSF